ncbi:MAG TPA: sugar porter family MFS transporter [Candidatus Limnocylindrales bacterium]|nr:sugar porter family MFS transporter [Candidatus Limnocylindrales bacterium]
MRTATTLTTPVRTMPEGSLAFVLLATGVAAIGGFLFGYDTAVINGANTYLKNYFALSPVQEGMAGASAILGCIPGATAAGFLSDRLGRKRLLFACALLYAGSGLLSALPRTFTEFLLARFLSGLAIGASSMICPVYIAEISPEKWRGRLGSLFQLGIVSGIFLTLFINKLIQGFGDEAWNTNSGWRWMLAMEVAPAVLFAALLFSVPESPRWLTAKGRQEAAQEVLTRIGGQEHAARELASIRAALAQQEGRFAELFTHAYFKPVLIAVVLMACSQFCGINAIIYYSTKIFESAGAVKNAAFTSTVWIGLINLLFTFVAIAFVDRAGRKPLLLIGAGVQAVALGLIGWMFRTGQNGMPLLACILLFIAAFAMAMGPITWILCSEIFPNKVRGRAMAIATFTIWTSCYIVAQTFPMLNDSKVIGPVLTFWTYGVVSLLTFLFVLFVVPETKGRTLEEIELAWRQNG